VSYHGITLHSGEECTVLLEPCGVNEGLSINGVPVSPHYILDTTGMTTHCYTSQIEHLLSGLYALGVSNLKISLDKNEFPVMDGGSKQIFDLIQSVGVQTLTETRPVWFPKHEVHVNFGDAFVTYVPPMDDDLRTHFKCSVDFPYVGSQEYEWTNTDLENYAASIAPAKTFFFDTQLVVEQQKPNRCKGIQPGVNCHLLNPTSCSTFTEKEFARHKLLDLIGDVNVLPWVIPGRFHAHKAGHKLHYELTYTLWTMWMTEQTIPPIPSISNFTPQLQTYKLKTVQEIYEKSFADMITMRFVKNTDSASSVLECQIPHMLQSKLKQCRLAGDITDRIYLPSNAELTDVEQAHIINVLNCIDTIDVVLIGVQESHLNELRKNATFNIIGLIDENNKDNGTDLVKYQTIEQAKQAGAFASIIATNADVHYDLVNQCLDHGLHVLFENPALLDLGDYERIMEKAARLNLSVCVAMGERYNVNYDNVPALNNIHQISITRIVREPESCVFMYDLLCHDLDLLWYKYGRRLDMDKVTIKTVNNMVTIHAMMGLIPVQLKVGYSNTYQEWTHVFTVKSRKQVKIDLNPTLTSTLTSTTYPLNSNLLLLDFANFLLKKPSRMCTLNDALGQIQWFKSEINSRVRKNGH
jgi:UDP-3-O-[3-hydroxymyristoyl] N-acetylglucosamine deacetylase